METITSFLFSSLQQDVETFLCEVAKRFTVDLEDLQTFSAKWWSQHGMYLPMKKKKTVISHLPKCEWQMKTKVCGAKCLTGKDMYCEKHKGMQEKAKERQKKVEHKEEQVRKKAHFGLSSKLSGFLRNCASETKQVFQVKRTNFGTYVHETEYGNLLVYDPVERLVYGRQIQDGSIAPLTLQDVDLCCSYHILYQLPENLEYEETAERKKANHELDIVEEFDGDNSDEEGSGGEDE